ncbi:MAG TPA: aminotransferase class I/II-fold pyridoxal phosphate-dependent enzyme [Lacipirellulaceae bacterium]|nr:aminotransferase class I/II-fold pyridoxal phosphate-dependent enzyme [Lacipirellulaceae bacterium]
MTGRLTSTGLAAGDQERAPIYETLAGYARSGIYGFHTPGHKAGRFAAPELTDLVGRSGLALDLPAMTATDNTFQPTGCIREAQQLAAEVFGASQTFFLSAGSTLGVAAALLATVPHGHTVAMPRNIHRSVVAGLVLSGALPRFLPHDVLPECGALGVSPRALATALDTDPRPAAVLLTRPSYYGVARDLGEIATVCRQRSVPLIIDEAHGAHLHFLPAGSPQSALAAGADLVVQSSHKTLGSLLGSAMLHVGRESPVDAARVQDALNFLQTTSPSFLLLASLDVMRRWMWREGNSLFAAAVDEAHRIENEIDALPGMRVLRPERDPRMVDHRRDPLRLVVNVSGTGWNGYEVERFLRTEYRVEDEMADWFNVVYVLSPRDDAEAARRLIAGLRAVSERGATRVVPGKEHGAVDEDSLLPAPSSTLLQPPIPPLAMPPRRAALARKAVVPLASATGRTCAEMVMFYPPGIPLLMPGEMVTKETVDVCRQLLAAGAHPYASDATLETIRVVE